MTQHMHSMSSTQDYLTIESDADETMTGLCWDITHEMDDKHGISVEKRSKTGSANSAELPSLFIPPSQDPEAPDHQAGTESEHSPRTKPKVFPRRMPGQSTAGRQSGQRPVLLEYDDLVPYFKLSQQQACSELGIGLSTMKRVCRKLGIKRWPGSLHSLADTFSWCKCTCKGYGESSSGGSSSTSSHQRGCPLADNSAASAGGSRGEGASSASADLSSATSMSGSGCIGGAVEPFGTGDPVPSFAFDPEDEVAPAGTKQLQVETEQSASAIEMDGDDADESSRSLLCASGHEGVFDAEADLGWPFHFTAEGGW